MTMNGEETALRALLNQRHMSYNAFCREWDRIAKDLDDALKGGYPAKAQFYRWLRGELANKRPYPDACRMLEAMFPGWQVEMLFEPYSEDSHPVASVPQASNTADLRTASGDDILTRRFSDLSGAFTGRSEFMSEFPLFDKIDHASLVRASGLSLNVFSQHYPDTQIRRLVECGTRFQLIFLNPQSDAMRLREQEEGYQQGFLAGLTDLNINIMRERVRDKLDPEIRDRFSLAISDDTVRFSITLIDQDFGVFQPYLPEARGVDSPTFVIETGSPESGFFHVFDQVFTTLWKRATII